jgi:anthranilate synthase component 1
MTPSLETFKTQWEQGISQVLHCTVAGDVETPVAAYLKVAADKPYNFLFESVEGGKFRGRYSFFGCDPDSLWRCDATQIDSAAVIQSLRAFIKDAAFPLPKELPSMAAGVFGFLGYDMVRHIEKLPPQKPDALNIPDAVLLRPSLLGVFDHVAETLQFFAPLYYDKAIAVETAYQQGVAKLKSAVAALQQPLPENSYVRASHLQRTGPLPAQGIRSEDAKMSRIPCAGRGPEIFEMTPQANINAAASNPPTSNFSQSEFEIVVNTLKNYIKAGDIFQGVLSQRFSQPYHAAPFDLYRALRRLNPSPYLFYLNLGDFQLVGSSPEILVKVTDNTVTIRPIAGTRPRGKTPAEDTALAADLLNDPKERAEHLMLLDLGRNDVGRVATAGSVAVTQQYTIEHYSHVMHIVSQVEGTLGKNKDALDALWAGFPAGTTSGAPKIRAMEIINDLETVKRSFYAGAVGYFSANGNMDTCIALRTALIKDGTLHVQAGAGIVADSNPTAEYIETCNKAKAILAAAQQV